IHITDFNAGDFRLLLVHNTSEEDITVLTGDKVTQTHCRLLAFKFLTAADEADGFYVVRADDFNPNFARGHGEEFAQLLAKNLRPLLCVLDVVVIRVAGFGEAGHKIFVVIIAHANCGHAESALGQVATETPEFPWRTRADIREAVRQEDDTIDSFGG